MLPVCGELLGTPFFRNYALFLQSVLKRKPIEAKTYPKISACFEKEE